MTPFIQQEPNLICEVLQNTVLIYIYRIQKPDFLQIIRWDAVRKFILKFFPVK
jgi:hypothetical protein